MHSHHPTFCSVKVAWPTKPLTAALSLSPSLELPLRRSTGGCDSNWRQIEKRLLIAGATVAIPAPAAARAVGPRFFKGYWPLPASDGQSDSI